MFMGQTASVVKKLYMYYITCIQVLLAIYVSIHMCYANFYLRLSLKHENSQTFCLNRTSIILNTYLCSFLVIPYFGRLPIYTFHVHLSLKKIPVCHPSFFLSFHLFIFSSWWLGCLNGRRNTPF